MNWARHGLASHRQDSEIAGPAAETVPIQIDVSAVNAPERARLCADALATTPADDHERRAALLAALAIAQSLSEPSRAPTTLTDALRAAAQAATPTATVHTLLAQYAIDLSPEALGRRLALSERAMTLLALDDCKPLRDDLLPLAHFMRVGALMESGDMQAVDAALSPELHLTDVIAQVLHSRFAVWFRCARASMDGQLSLAERFAHEGHALAVERGDVDADSVFAGQVAVIRWMQGRVAEMEPAFVHARRIDPAEPIWAAVVAWIWAHQGRGEAARGLIESLPDMNEAPRGRNWLAAAAILAEVAADIGSDDLVEQLRFALAPFADRMVSAGLGLVCWGTAARPLALLARRQGRHDEARAHYRDAIATCSRIGAQAWLARAQGEYGALELEHGNVSAARRLAGEAAAAARHLGLESVAQQADLLLARTERASRVGVIGHTASGNSPGSGKHSGAVVGISAGHPQAESPRITVLGHFSVTPAGGPAAEWRSRKARTLLQVLVARRGAPVSREAVMDVLWPGTDPTLLRNRLSVALTAVRRAFDPERRHSPERYIVADSDVIRLRKDRLSIDVEEFLALAESARAAEASSAEREWLLRTAVAAYQGEVLIDEPYAAWAETLRRHTQLAFFAAAHSLADLLANSDEHVERIDVCRRVLQLDPYDERAHDSLIDSLTALGATGHARAARRERARLIAEVGLPHVVTDR